MAVVSPREKDILMQMGFAEDIIPVLVQSVADRAIAEFFAEGVPLDRIPGQTSSGDTFGAPQGVLGLTTAGDDPGTSLGAAFPDPAEALNELRALIPDIPVTLILVVLGLLAVAVIVLKVT